MSNFNSMQTCLLAAQRKDTIPVMRAVVEQPRDIAAVTKLVAPAYKRKYDNKQNMTIETPSTTTLHQVSREISERMTDADNMFSTLPDLELSFQILSSSILAPKDLVTTELTFTNDYELFTPTLLATLLDSVKTYFAKTYKIKERLPRLLGDMLYRSGSHPLVVLPENAIDDLINARSNFSLESLPVEAKTCMGLSFGYLGNSHVEADSFASFEAFTGKHRPVATYEPSVYLVAGQEKVDLKLRVVDNFNMLKLPLLAQAASERRSSSLVNKGLDTEGEVSFYSLESIKKTNPKGFEATDLELEGLLYKSRNRSNDTIRTVKTQAQLNRRSVGEPLTMSLPSESVIPVVVPGNEELHVGYFVLMDQNGNPITRQTSPNPNGAMGRAFGESTKSDFASAMLARVKYGLNGSEFNCQNSQHQNLMVRTYEDVVEADLLARLRNGVYSGSAKLASNEEIYRIMLARALSDNLTQALWVPKELMTYFALDYDTQGIGVSLLNKLRVLSSMRAMVLFADVRSSIRNSVGMTHVDVTLDPEDGDPEQTFEQLVHEVMRTRQDTMPVGIQNPNDISYWMGRSGIQFSVAGNDRMPGMRVETTERNSNYAAPDDKLKDLLEKYSARAIGITPEMIDNLHQPEHVATIVNNNIMLTKRVNQYQDILNPQLADHCQKRLRYSESFMRTVNEIVKNNFADIELTEELRERAGQDEDVKRAIIGMVVRDFINELEVSLPRPEAAVIDNVINDLESTEKLYELMVKHMFSAELFSADLVGEMGGSGDDIGKSIISSLMLKEFAKAGVGAELMELLNSENGAKAFEDFFLTQQGLLKNAVAGWAKHVKDMQAFRDAADKAKETLEIQGGGGGSSSYGSDFGGDAGATGDDSGYADFATGAPDDAAPAEPDAGAAAEPVAGAQEPDAL